MIVANQALTTSKLQMVSELLNDDQNADIRSQIFSTYLEDSHAGADKIIEFANKNGIVGELQRKSAFSRTSASGAAARRGCTRFGA